MENEPNEELSTTARTMRAAAPYLGAVWKLVGSAVFGVGVGYYLDGRLGTKPWMLVGLSTVSIAVGFYAFTRDLLRMGQKP